ncbi:DUF504 domain-containing protein [Methylotuvimicrobium buryatense]|uniref:DUF504 domain-containing protein n=1 Tax=Methylotuvimicrobium buryatense TaxID=95641 RepID=A0A4P9ULU4_METBY|nr:DUF504 domain-containing protein [Methylotuvimicrobium buryatense]QCW81121.1 DUF504 domain-containing protein [Methylotuvimicrobium buryatense]
MQPVQDILNRIRWDEHWKGDEFKIGYYDRIEDRLIVVAFNEIRFPKGDHFTFEVIDQDGELHSVPYHRVKAIFRNGDLIWHRKH